MSVVMLGRMSEAKTQRSSIVGDLMCSGLLAS